jgi:translation initiation factor 1A
MVNFKGGKNYKKAKGGGDDGPAFVERMDDQIYGRVIKNLGNCNMIVYCNDNKRRFCHIRGAIRKRMWMNAGDIVLVSVRDFEKVDVGEMERGDIITKYDSKHYGKLKKLADFNQRLLCELEKVNFDSDQAGNLIAGLMTAMERGDDSAVGLEDAGFEFDVGGGGNEVVEGNEEEQTVVPAFSRRNARIAAISTPADDDIDIDNI